MTPQNLPPSSSSSFILPPNHRSRSKQQDEQKRQPAIDLLYKQYQEQGQKERYLREQELQQMHDLCNGFSTTTTNSNTSDGCDTNDSNLNDNNHNTNVNSISPEQQTVFAAYYKQCQEQKQQKHSISPQQQAAFDLFYKKFQEEEEKKRQLRQLQDRQLQQMHDLCIGFPSTTTTNNNNSHDCFINSNKNENSMAYSNINNNINDHGAYYYSGSVPAAAVTPPSLQVNPSVMTHHGLITMPAPLPPNQNYHYYHPNSYNNYYMPNMQYYYTPNTTTCTATNSMQGTRQLLPEQQPQYQQQHPRSVMPEVPPPPSYPQQRDDKNDVQLLQHFIHHANQSAAALVPPRVYSTTANNTNNNWYYNYSSNSYNNICNSHNFYYGAAPRSQQQYQPITTTTVQNNSLSIVPKTITSSTMITKFDNNIVDRNVLTTNSSISPKNSSNTRSVSQWYPKNPLFHNIPYCDDYSELNCLEYIFEPDEGKLSELFLPKIDDLSTWLQTRKRKWRQSNYKVYPIEKEWFTDDDNEQQSTKKKKLRSQIELYDDDERISDRFASSVPVDYWSHHGYVSFEHWLTSSITKWKTSYSWNRMKKKQLEHDCFEMQVHIETTDFRDWLRIRKSQWKVLRRKRQRKQKLSRQISDNNLQPKTLMYTDSPIVSEIVECDNVDDSKIDGDSNDNSLQSFDVGDTAAALSKKMKKLVAVSSHSSPSSSLESSLPISPTTVLFINSSSNVKQQQKSDLNMIDELLEEQEEIERIELERVRCRVPLDISFIFDSNVGCPDDIIVHIFEYLNQKEHGKFLCLNSQTRNEIIKREQLWQQLCPNHWKLPRRPRKPWHEIYLTKLRDEIQSSEKLWDDLLMSVAAILVKGDCLLQIEKAIAKAEEKTKRGGIVQSFDINYVSGVVCERNSVLNLAVIHQRHKVAKWLVEKKNADIESCDRGNFTALLNAAWNGDRYLVRFLLQRGADRSKLGTCHYTKALAPPGFDGYTAEEWAEKRGHADVAKLLRIGL